MSCRKFNHRKRGHKQCAFTLVELMVGITVISILAIITLPNLNRFIVDLRVEGEISKLHRLLLTARNASINSGQNVVICPVVSGTCTDDWTKEITVFVDINRNNSLNLPNEEVVKVKSASNNKDKFQYTGGAFLTYNALGNLVNNNIASLFRYCPEGFSKASKGIIVSPSGRAYISQDQNGDGIDEDRANNNIKCS